MTKGKHRKGGLSAYFEKLDNELDARLLEAEKAKPAQPKRKKKRRRAKPSSAGYFDCWYVGIRVSSVG